MCWPYFKLHLAPTFFFKCVMDKPPAWGIIPQGRSHRGHIHTYWEQRMLPFTQSQLAQTACRCFIPSSWFPDTHPCTPSCAYLFIIHAHIDTIWRLPTGLVIAGWLFSALSCISLLLSYEYEIIKAEGKNIFPISSLCGDPLTLGWAILSH